MMHFGRFRIDRDRFVLEYDGRALSLAPKSVELLAALVERGGETVGKRELLERLWPDSIVEEANLSQHVYVIRRALGSCDSAARAAIVTVPKRGYRFVPMMVPVAVASPPVAGEPPRRARIAAVALALVVVMLLTGGSDRAVKARPVGQSLSADGLQASRIGRYNLDLRTPTGIARSRAYFARVIASDPKNPSGYAGLADALTLTADYRVGRLAPTIYIQRAAALAKRALELGPLSAEAHASVGLAARYSHDTAKAERELERAIELDPAYAPAHHWLGAIAFDRGDFARSMRELTIANELNPISTASNAWLEVAAYFLRKYDIAVEHGKRAIELDPSRHGTLRELGLAYDAQGNYRAALATFGRIRKDDDAWPSVPYLLAAVYAHAGRPQVARRILLREGSLGHVDPELPFALIAVGNAKAAVAAAARLRFSDCQDRRLFIADPRLDAVRHDAALGRLLHGRCVDRD